jgi:hypothetical protein
MHGSYIMAELLSSVTKPSIQATGLIDLAGMLIVKRVVDAGAVPIVGNNNLMSGAAKLLIGGILHGKGGRIGNVLTGGVVLDGVDDIAGVVMQKIMPSGAGGAGQQTAVNPGL